MQQHWVLLMLLAILWYVFNAQAKTFLINKDVVTSLLSKGDATVEGGKHRMNLDDIVTVQMPSSAVQNWSLVCQQLCGAGLGGAVCAPYCKTLKFLPYNVKLENAEEIMDSKKDLICPKLCGLQFGDEVCTCSNYITDDFDAYMKSSKKTNVCAILCDHNGVTLTGCTPCNGKINTQYVILESVKTLSEQSVPFEPFDANTPTTTPDWNELCASLCKTGDGGSLCNCNLSPFYV